MKNMKPILTTALLAALFTASTAHAQQSQQRGIIDCGARLVACLTGGGGLQCLPQFLQCLAAGKGASTADTGPAPASAPRRTA